MIRVLIVDDSAIVRRKLRQQLETYKDIHIVGDAVDPYDARDKMFQLKPDVLTLDIEMPRMDGLSFLTKIMAHKPTPVVVLSSLTPKNSDTASRALLLGAVEVIGKPGSQLSVPEVSKHLVGAIRNAARAKVTQRPSAGDTKKRLAAVGTLTTHKVVALGASTGGPRALESVISSFPADTPGVVVAQHMPAHFTSSFAERLNEASAMEVREARDGDAVVPGCVFVAPGDQHMCITKCGARYLVSIKKGPRVQFQRPSVDVLFQSVAKNVGRNCVGALLTGMGKDGASGLLAMRQAGARCFAEDESTCVVFGMPREAVMLGAAEETVRLDKMAQAILTAVKQEQQDVATVGA